MSQRFHVIDRLCVLMVAVCLASAAATLMADDAEDRKKLYKNRLKSRPRKSLQKNRPKKLKR